MSMADWAENYDDSHNDWMLSRRKLPLPPPDKLVEEMSNLLKLPGMFPETRQLIEQAIKAQSSPASRV